MTRKKFVTFEKINSFKRGVVRAVLVGIVTIMTGGVCLRAQVGVYFFKSKKFFLRVRLVNKMIRWKLEVNDFYCGGG